MSNSLTKAELRGRYPGMRVRMAPRKNKGAYWRGKHVCGRQWVAIRRLKRRLRIMRKGVGVYYWHLSFREGEMVGK
jgi:hypothetical protein